MAEPMIRPGISAEDYLEIERAAEERHELIDGEMFAMSALGCELAVDEIYFKVFDTLSAGDA